MSRPAPFAALAASVLLLGACAQTQMAADPCATANAPVSFGMLLSNTVSGNYGACIDTMREDLAIERLRARALETQAAQLRDEERRLAGQQRAAAARLAEMNERQAATMAEIEQANRATTAERTRLEALIAEQRRLTDEIEALNARGGGASTAEAEAISQRQDRVRAQLLAVL